MNKVFPPKLKSCMVNLDLCGDCKDLRHLEIYTKEGNLKEIPFCGLLAHPVSGVMSLSSRPAVMIESCPIEVML